ncbi:S-adenosyl-L-methionine-dependent methyltransferase [Biscogniauxia marginata]|nr:S-adenosyl-L-methionine-dependent methyltransferase [Biscogniauxia marginata]
MPETEPPTQLRKEHYFSIIMSSAAPTIDPNPRLQSYYASIESVLGYDLILGGTRHFGYYEKGMYNPFPISRSLRQMEKQLFNALHLSSGSKVLDAGCGNGHVARYMAQQGLRVTGIDVVERHARMARKTAKESNLNNGSLEVHHMDYHHLESFKDSSFDGVYTMETVVHAVDPESVLAGFFRVIRPGGRIAMHEYDNVLQKGDAKIQENLKRSMAQVNEWSAMPTNAISSPDAFKNMLERAGFVDVEVRDLSDNILPMTRFFFTLAIVPFLIISLLGLERYFINTVAGVQSYRGRGFWRYIQISARKPEDSSNAVTR